MQLGRTSHIRDWQKTFRRISLAEIERPRKLWHKVNTEFLWLDLRSQNRFSIEPLVIKEEDDEEEEEEEEEGKAEEENEKEKEEEKLTVV